MASGSVRVPVVAIASIGGAVLHGDRSRRMAWSYGLQPFRERPVKIFERHDVFAVFETRPTHNQSGFFWFVAAAAHGFGSCYCFKFIHRVRVNDNVPRLIESPVCGDEEATGSEVNRGGCDSKLFLRLAKRSTCPHVFR